MKVLTKLLGAGVVVGAVGVGAAIVIKKRRARSPKRSDIAGTMLVSELSELEISSGPLDTRHAMSEGFDPDVIPSAHQEIDDLIASLPRPR